MTGKVILVCGGRDFEDFDFICRALNKHQPAAIVHGEFSPGARDGLTGQYARHEAIDEVFVKLNWGWYGQGAIADRNTKLFNRVRALVDEVVAFPGGSGTANMVAKAKAAGIPVHEVKP